MTSERPITADSLTAREWQALGGETVRYRWHAPQQRGKDELYPLVLFFHGAGERGDDNLRQLTHGALPLLEHAAALDEPCFLIAPQCPAGRWWAEPQADRTRLGREAEPNLFLEAVLELVRQTIDRYPVDPARFYVTGLSMGGFATWEVLSRIPQIIAAAIPVCGGGRPEAAGRFAHVPIRLFHGSDDDVVPLAASETMAEALRKAGSTAAATYYPGVAHDSWSPTYDNREVIRWLFAQRRAAPDAVGI